MTTAPASRPTAVPAPAPRAGSPSRPVPRIVILGGGYGGLSTALRLRRRLGRRDASIVVVDPRSYMTYQPFLPEAAAGSLEPRHVVVSHRQVLRAVDVRSGRVTQVRHAERTVRIAPEAGPEYEIGYDHLVVALGSVSRTLPIPGLAEEGIGFKHVEEAIALRNHALARLDAAASTSDADQRRRLLTFVFVGGGFAGVEALAEVEDMARAAVRGGRYEGVREEDLRFVLIEGSTRILPELGDEMGGYALEQLRRRGIEVHLATFLSSCVGGHVVTSTGLELDAATIVWTAGVRANPVLAAPTSRWTTPGAFARCRRSRWRMRAASSSTASGPRATAPRCRTSRTPVSCARPAPSTPCVRHATWGTTSPPTCTGRPRGRTGTSTSGPLPRSAWARASRRSTG